MIPFNKPFLSGNETRYINQAVESGHISGNGNFTKKCQLFFETRYGIKKALLTTSCTDALEMCAILADVKPGDEVIVPSYTFVSTALPFIRQGAKIVFADSQVGHPNLDVENIEALITANTKVIVPVHYAGMACDMDAIMGVAKRHNLIVIEDAAQAIEGEYKGRALGTIGHLAAFSFHETKNIISGEGGLLLINDERFIKRSEVIWEKGTNRAEFFRGEINKYGWVDIGSSFLPSDIIAAYLWAQLENIESIQAMRLHIWNRYMHELGTWAHKNQIHVPEVPSFSKNNGHIFYLVCKDLDQRNIIISALRKSNIHAVFHYLSLHQSEFFKHKYNGPELLNSDRYSNCLVRLPLYYELGSDQDQVISALKDIQF